MAQPGFELEITELRLGLPNGTRNYEGDKNEKKRVFSEINKPKAPAMANKSIPVVGWPPVCSYRRKSIGNEKDCIDASKKLVKVSMDGTPFLRKIDVRGFKEYFELLAALEKLFGCSDLKVALGDADISEYVPIYEDKDGDWLLVGDVPWNMFFESCKRLRIMKRGDSKGFNFQCKTQCHG